MVYKGSLTMDERLFIHCYYTSMSRGEIAAYLNVSYTSIKTYLDTRKMTLTIEQKKSICSRLSQIRNNSSQFDDFIKANYLKMPTKTLGNKIGKTGGFVWARLKFLGLEIPIDTVEKFKQQSYFKPGNISHNKGQKMSEETYLKVSRTFFNKGNVPHNAKKNGEEVVRRDSKGQKYLMIKIPEKRKLEYKHRVLWEQHNGPIPKGYNVQFKDGDTLNCVIENLYLIDRSNQVKENFYKPEAIAKRFLKMDDEDIAYAKVHAPGLIEAKAMQIKLKSILNKKQNEVKRSNKTI